MTMRYANHCDRCNGPLVLSMMSKFNTDILCTQCQDDECEAPGYAAADAAEVAAVRAGDYNFLGTGLSPQDHAFLAARRAARKSQNVA
jgi:hypothetical protein